MMYAICHKELYCYFDGQSISPDVLHLFTKVEAMNIIGEDDNEDNYCMINLDGGMFSIVETDYGLAVIYYRVEYDDSAEPDIFGKYRANDAFCIITDIRDQYDNPVSLEKWNEAEMKFNRA